MTRYKLPAELGGAEFEPLTLGPYTVSTTPGSVFIRIGDLNVGLPLEILTEVKPPIPDEPEPGAWRIGAMVCFRRRGTDRSRWIMVNDHGHDYGDWAEVVETVGVEAAEGAVRLVPEPSPRCARCGVTGVALPHGPAGMKVCEACNTAVDAEVTVARGGSWKHADRSGDHVEIGRDFDSAYLLAFEGSSRTCVRLDSHEARMGAIAAIHAADEAIGGEE